MAVLCVLLLCWMSSGRCYMNDVYSFVGCIVAYGDTHTEARAGISPAIASLNSVSVGRWVAFTQPRPAFASSVAQLASAFDCDAWKEFSRQTKRKTKLSRTLLTVLQSHNSCKEAKTKDQLSRTGLNCQPLDSRFLSKS